MSSKRFIILVTIVILFGLGIWLGKDLLFEDPISSRAKKVNSQRIELRRDFSGY